MPNEAYQIGKALGLFVLTALAEIIGCYLPYLWLKQDKSGWLLLPASISLILFVWLLSLHPQMAGRVYAAYGGVYISVALLWLWGVESIQPNWTDWLGVGLCLCGVFVMLWGAKP